MRLATGFQPESLMPWTMKDFVKDEDPAAILITINGVLLGCVREAKAGKEGWATHAIMMDGNFVVDSYGIPQFEKEHGLVEFWFPKVQL